MENSSHSIWVNKTIHQPDIYGSKANYWDDSPNPIAMLPGFGRTVMLLFRSPTAPDGILWRPTEHEKKLPSGYD